MDVIFELESTSARGISHNGGDTTQATAKSSGVVVPAEAAADHGRAAAVPLLRRTVTQRAPAAPWSRRRWRCRVCQVECGGRDGFREHCMSDEHYQGLQLFVLYPDHFADGVYR